MKDAMPFEAFITFSSYEGDLKRYFAGQPKYELPNVPITGGVFGVDGIAVFVYFDVG